MKFVHYQTKKVLNTEIWQSQYKCIITKKKWEKLYNWRIYNSQKIVFTHKKVTFDDKIFCNQSSTKLSIYLSVFLKKFSILLVTYHRLLFYTGLLYVDLSISPYPNSSPQTGCDTRSIFKRSTAGLNSVFFLLHNLCG